MIDKWSNFITVESVDKKHSHFESNLSLEVYLGDLGAGLGQLVLLVGFESIQ